VSRSIPVLGVVASVRTISERGTGAYWVCWRRFLFVSHQLFAALARRDGLIPTYSAVDVKPPKARRNSPGRALTDDEIAALIGASDRVDPATAPIVWLMARCGLQIGEVLALQCHDLDLDAGTLRVERSLSRHEGVRPLKSRSQGESRTIPLPADVVVRLREHPVPLHPEGRLFPTGTGNAMSDANWRKRTWRRIKASAGVE
jgi:integrase